ncbi:TlpA family protein disulfide reductase [Saccharicrinis sp. FJH54]|uniref:TlpA family protein disulfide reductase n=1 Tax=Saccharicrinis sp. FJH54 TaxID=3344665 RepID=UPI0035D4908F
MRSSVICFLMVVSGCISTVAMATKTIVAGKAASAGRRQLELTTHKQQIFEHPELLASAETDSSGTFVFSFDISEIRSVTLNMGSYTLRFLIEPGDSVFLKLGNYVPLTRGQLYDPYFKPDIFLFVPEAGRSAVLNDNVLKFETWYDSLYQSAMQTLIVSRNDSFTVAEWHKQFGSAPKSTFFDRYKWYTSSSLYKMAYPYAKDSLIKLYFASPEPDEENPAFWDAFNATFKPAMIEEGTNTLYQTMVEPIWKSDFRALHEAVKVFYGISNDAMTDLVILKGVYEVWYLFPDLQPMLEKLLNQATELIQDENIRAIAGEMLQELTAMMPAKPAPDVKLVNKHGFTLNLAKPGKYVLLGFVSPELLQCRRDFIIQDESAKKYGNRLIMANVVLHQPQKDFLEFDAAYKGSIQFIYPDQPEKLADKFRIKGLPQYYLIDPDGRIIATPRQGGLVQMFKKLETLYK